MWPARDIDLRGFCVVGSALHRGTLAALQAEFPVELHARRNLLETNARVAELAASVAMRRLVLPVLGPACFAVRATFFNKALGRANWKVPWHQDQMIAVRRRLEVPGFQAWSVKAGVTYAQPPASVLEWMLAVRVHLDDCGADDGALRMIPGSHLAGRLTPFEIGAWRDAHTAVAAEARAGDALLMRPLLLHASPESLKRRGRRVIHLEYAAGELPGGLEWAVRIR